jgi:ribosome biogenesis GTP-binding protein YsxC/EngB
MIGFLPLLMGITMWIQMRINPAPPDPTQAMIFNWMPVFFTFLLASFPAGLVLYWTWNNLLSVLQQGVHHEMALVDMPGYGYAKAPKDQVDLWTKLVFDYMRGRSTLKRVYLLIDSRHGLKKNDEGVMDLLDKAAMSYQVVLTKTDKIKAAGVPRLISETLAALKRRPAAYPEVIATSSEKGEGIAELRTAIALAITL